MRNSRNMRKNMGMGFEVSVEGDLQAGDLAATNSN